MLRRMNLLEQAFLAVKWMLGILKMFMRVRPGATLMVIGVSVLSRITNVLTFFLPLKVILLAGSDGVPRYFRFFIAPEEKSDWIVWLSIAAVASYVLTLLFDGLSERLADLGSAGVLEGANKLALVGKQRAQARSNYSKVTQIVAAAVFALVGLVVLAIINPVLLGALSVLLFIELLFTAVILNGWHAAYPGRFQSFIYDNLGEYLNILSSINFLASFFVLLMPFLLGENGNILFAILAVLVIRQALRALASGINGLVDLYKDRHLVDPLIFRRRQLQSKEPPEDEVIREFFNKASRQMLAEKLVAPVQPSDFQVCWQDSPIKGAYTFIISFISTEGRRERFQQQLFPAKQVHLLANEEYLFSKVKRRDLNAAEVISRFREGSFECQICEYGSVKPLPLQSYKAALVALLIDAWCFSPPRSIVSAFNTARSSLPGRLTDEMIARLAVAVDSSHQEATLNQLQARLPELRKMLKQLPLYIFNPDVSQANVREFAPGEIRIMTWTRWAIEPIGAGIPSGFPQDRLADVLECVNSRRQDLQIEVKLKDIELAAECWNIEREINSGRYKAALKTAMKIIARLS